MPNYNIHPIVLGTKIFDKSMMTYQYGQGQSYTIPIYSWYIEDVEDNGQIKTVRQDMEIIPGINVIHTPAHTPGGMTVFVETHMGRAAITGFRVIDENFDPPKEIRAMEMDVIPPGTHVDTYKAYDIMTKVKEMADLIIPIHEPRFACMETIPS